MVNLHVGFSGTQEGMTSEQIQHVDYLLEDALTTDTAHHGDCIGADADFHRLITMQRLHTVGHPPVQSRKRAFCKFDEERSPLPYLDRNKAIVEESDWMIFCPKGEEELRSGTWSTVRYAIRSGTPGWIVWPDGRTENLNEYSPKF